MYFFSFLYPLIALGHSFLWYKTVVCAGVGVGWGAPGEQHATGFLTFLLTPNVYHLLASLVCIYPTLECCGAVVLKGKRWGALFCPQTFGNVWIHFWLSQLGVGCAPGI